MSSAVLTRNVARVRKLVRIVQVPSFRRALRHRVAAATEHERTPLDGDFRTVLDVGANRGQFALVARERWPRARMICFEPLDRPREILSRVVGSSGSVEVRAAALSDTQGTASFHVSAADDSSSLLAITERQAREFPGTAEARTVTVPTARLDDEVPAQSMGRPALLKIDVQGGELGVLRGAERALGEVDTVLVECSFAELYAGQPLADDVIRLLQAKGFRVADIASPSYDATGRMLQADFIFRRDGIADGAS